MNKIFSITFLTLILSLGWVLGYPSDEIISLPGLNHKINFKQYSGFLNVTQNRHYFYWFVESQSNPQTDPVVLWLNGGPGCSSLLGLMTENGPFRVSSDGKTLSEHPFSWNKVANVLYLESPAGVGFSYDDNKDYKFTNKRTAEDNYSALQRFFEKFPHFNNNSFYITGESYGGIYIPMLAIEMMRKNTTINLKGLAIGNGLLDGNYETSAKGVLEYGVGHGLISARAFEDVQQSCCKCLTQGYECSYANRTNKDCSDKMSEAVSALFVTNPYNIDDDCPPDVYYAQTFHQFYSQLFDFMPKFDYNSAQPGCEPSGQSTYLNSAEVRKALHIPPQLAKKWHSCGFSYQAYSGDEESLDMKPNFIELIEKYKIQSIIIYNGVLDTMCDFITDQYFVDGLGLEMTEKFKKWTVNGVTGGYVQRYKGLSFMTIRKAGHMVPTDNPKAALKMFEELIGLSKVDSN